MLKDKQHCCYTKKGMDMVEFIQGGRTSGPGTKGNVLVVQDVDVCQRIFQAPQEKENTIHFYEVH